MNNIIPIAITWGLMSVIYTAIYGDRPHPSEEGIGLANFFD